MSGAAWVANVMLITDWCSSTTGSYLRVGLVGFQESLQVVPRGASFFSPALPQLSYF